MIKESEIRDILKGCLTEENPVDCIMAVINQYFELKPRDLTEKELSEHPLVVAYKGNNKEEVKLYLMSLTYERKRSYVSENE